MPEKSPSNVAWKWLTCVLSETQTLENPKEHWTAQHAAAWHGHGLVVRAIVEAIEVRG